MWICRRLTLELHAYRSYDVKSLLLSWCVAVVNECESSPCVNGVCQDLVNHYYCQCSTGWTGRNCDQSKYSTGWTGRNCDQSKYSTGWTGRNCDQSKYSTG